MIHVLKEINEEFLRGTGRTTRLADNAIQELFNKGVTLIKDHIDNKVSDEFLLNTVVNRLITEHRGLKFQVKRYVGVEYYFIELIK